MKKILISFLLLISILSNTFYAFAEVETDFTENAAEIITNEESETPNDSENTAETITNEESETPNNSENTTDVNPNNETADNENKESEITASTESVTNSQTEFIYNDEKRAEFFDFIMSIITNSEPSPVPRVEAYSKQTYFRSPLGLASCDEKVHKIAANRILDFYELIINESELLHNDTNAFTTAEEYISKNEEDINKFDYYGRLFFDFYINNTHKDLDIQIFDNYIRINIYSNYQHVDIIKLQYLYFTDNPQKFISFLGNDDLTVWGLPEDDWSMQRFGDDGFDFENGTQNGQPITFIDEVTFEVDITEENYHGVFRDVAEPNETVKCKIEYIKYPEGKLKEIFLATFEGSKGKQRHYNEVWDKNFSNNPAALQLEYFLKVIDGALVTQQKYYKPEWTMRVRADGANNIINGIKLIIQYKEREQGDCTLEAKNINYKYNLDDEEFKKGRHLCAVLIWNEEERQQAYQQQIEKEQQAAQDPEYYITNMFAYNNSGKLVQYYWINVAAEATLDLEKFYAPEWYKKLGDNVKLTILGITKSISGVEKPYTMLRFKGTNGEKWFNMGNGTISNLGSHTIPRKLCEYEFVELISFDGKQMIRNTKDYNTVYATMTYGNGANGKLQEFKLRINGEEIKLSIDDLNYIGSDAMYYQDMSR